METKFIYFQNLQHYINSLKLVCTDENMGSFEKIIQHLNLGEFSHFNFKSLDKTNSILYIYQYLEDGKNIDDKELGIVAVKLGANKYLQLALQIIKILSEIYTCSVNKDYVLTDKLKDYVEYIRNQGDFFDTMSSDVGLINSHAFLYLDNFVKCRNYLLNIDSSTLHHLYVTLYIKLEKL